MPKENTHIYFATKLLKKLDNQELSSLLRNHINSYYLGSLTPDTFYYNKDHTISDFLHGVHGNLTNDIIFKFLDSVKKTKNQQDLAFILGYISHCALDIIFHPIIYFLSGDYYDSNKIRRIENIYLHRHLETSLDNIVSNFGFNLSINKKMIKSLNSISIISNHFKITTDIMLQTYKKQIWTNKLFKIDLLFNLAYLLFNLGIYKNKTNLGFFYRNLAKDKTTIPKEYDFQDIITGEKSYLSIDELFLAAQKLAIDMQNAAHTYHKGIITKKECAKIISGKSLETGKLNCPISDMKFTL